MNPRAAYGVVLALCLGCGNETKTGLTPPPFPRTDRPADEAARLKEALVAEHGASQLDEQPAGGELQDYVSFPSVGVKLRRPPGFDDGENFHGFQQAATQASILIVSMPAAYAEIAGGLTAEQLQTKGMRLIDATDVTVGGGPALLLRASQNANGLEYYKWMLVFGDDETTKLITCTYPVSEPKSLGELLKAAVLSAQYDVEVSPETAPDVGFSLTAAGKMKFTKEMSKLLLYTDDGAFPSRSPENPLFIAGRSLGAPTTSDKRQYAVQRLFSTASTKISTVTSQQEITIDGLSGYEIIADGQDSKSGTLLIVYQVILYDGDFYYLMQGLVGRKRSGEFLPEFKAMVRSFTRVPEE